MATKEAALKVVVGNRADALGAQRLPGEVFAAVPATSRAGNALPRGHGCLGPLGPLGPLCPGRRVEGLADDPVEAGALETMEPILGGGGVARGGREVDRGPCPDEGVLEAGPALALGAAAPGLGAHGQPG